jgi:sulfatase maturation enzyme AslB (radical SAM superfamily)
MRVSNQFKRSNLGVDTVKRMIDHAAKNGFEAISFTGGEPLLALDEICTLIKHAYRSGIHLTRTGTNGFLFKNPDSPKFLDRIKALIEKLADTPLYTFWISIDSADPGTHEKMRGFKNVIKGIEKALPYFHDAGIFPAANLGINRNIGGCNEYLYQVGSGKIRFHSEEFYHRFREAFRKFYRFLLTLGFTMANSCYPMSEDDSGETVYAASSEDLVVRFSNQEKLALFRAFFETRISRHSSCGPFRTWY